MSRTKYRWQVFALIVNPANELNTDKTKISGVYYLNPTVAVGASNFRLQDVKELSYKVTMSCPYYDD